MQAFFVCGGLPFVAGRNVRRVGACRRAAIAAAGCPRSTLGYGDDGAGALQSLQPALRGGLVVGSEDHAVPLRHPAYLSSLLRVTSTS